MEATSLTNELMAGIASQYSDTLNPPYEKGFDELREAGYRELQMEISFLHSLASFADIASEQEEKITVEGSDSLREICTQTIKRRIDFDRSTHSMQMIEGAASRPATTDSGTANPSTLNIGS